MTADPIARGPRPGTARVVGGLLIDLGDVPALPGAVCKGRPKLFDPPQPFEPLEAFTARHAAAVRLCEECPALTACREWSSSLPRSKRPAGVLAGRQPTVRGRRHALMVVPA